MDLLNVIKLGW
jgi:hypothetical protein